MTLAPPGHEVIADVPCRKCGYNLRSLSTEGRCPECGTAVWPSLSAPPSLDKAYGPWLRKIRRGAWCIVAAYGTMLALFSIGMLLRNYPELASVALHLLLLALVLVLLVSGSILFSRPEPYSGSLDETPTLRPAIWLSAAVLPFAASVTILTGDLLIILALSGSLLVNQASIVLYVSALAERTRARVLACLGLPAAIVIACLWTGIWVSAIVGFGWIMLFLLMAASATPALWLAWFLIRAPRTGRSDTTPYTQTLTAPVSSAPAPAR